MNDTDPSNDAATEGAPARARHRRQTALSSRWSRLTRTRKVRRRFVAERYGELVAALCGDREAVTVKTAISYQDGRSAEIETELEIESVEEVPSQRYSPMHE